MTEQRSSGILVLMLLVFITLAARDAKAAKLSVDAKMREDTDLSQVCVYVIFLELFCFAFKAEVKFLSSGSENTC